MNRYVERGWRPLFGALAIGLAAFGLSLQGAPAGDGTDLLVARGADSADAAATSSSRNAATENTAEFTRQRKALPLPGQSEESTDPTELDMTAQDTVMHVGRVISGTPVHSKGGKVATSRAAGTTPLGGECSCDEDCDAADGDQCNLVQCIVRSTCTGTDPEDQPCSIAADCAGNGTCDTSVGAFVQRCDTIQLVAWPCDDDNDFCTLDRCEDDTFGNNHSICVAQDTGAGGDLSPCAKRCVGGPAHGLACDRASDCAQGSCQIMAGGGCDSASESCYVGASLATAIGRCCIADACTETEEGDCAGAWYRYRSPADLEGDGNCLCPKYGSGVTPPGSDEGRIGLVRPSGLICQVGSDHSDTEVYCETPGTDTEFCQDRCFGGDYPGQPCTVDFPDCAQFGTCSVTSAFCVVANEGSDCTTCSIAGNSCFSDTDCPEGETCESDGSQTCNAANLGSCGPDTCASNTNEGSCEDGFLSVGDDYSLENASFLRLSQFRFRGGITNLGEDFVIEFWNSAGTKLVDSFEVPNLGRTGTHDWTIEVDCWPNCDPVQLEVPEQNPIIIPPTGYVIMRATRTVATINGSASFWEQTDSPADVGLNDDTKAWVNGPDQSVGTNVFIFELVGTKVPEPLGACCDDAESCEDTTRWDCGICSITELLCASTLHDCPNALSENEFCQFNRWFGPISHDDFQGLGSNLTLCEGNAPCDSGACCTGNTCAVITPDACTAAEGEFQGIATNCSPNCCPVDTPTGTDCICETSTCVETATTCLGGPDDGVACTLSAECAPTEGGNPVVCDLLNTGNLCVTDADCIDGVSTCVLLCTPNPVITHLRHPYECYDDFGSALEPRVDCDSLDPVECTDIDSAYTCEQSFTGSYSVTRNDTIPTDTIRVVDGERCSINTAADRVGWYEPFELEDPTPGLCDGDGTTECRRDADCDAVGGPCTGEDGADDCYILTVGLCCTDPIMSPIWPFLSSYRNCPCSESADVIGTSPDFDLANEQLDGYGASSKARLAGRCQDGNYSATFTVPPGEYAYQVDADFACAGSTITCDDDDDCPGSSCGLTNDNYSVIFTTESCQLAACCVNDTCIITNILDCIAQDGNFLGLGDQPITSCQVGACSIGACCIDGSCEDNENYNTIGECEGQDGVYLGGVVCADNPCPACPFNYPATCQQVQTTFGAVPVIDRNPFRNEETTVLGEGSVLADDVKFGGSVVDEICWNAGFYGEPCCATNCVMNIDTTWEIRIYAEDPEGCNGLPGPEIGRSAITVLNKVEGTGQETGSWHYAGTLENEIDLTGTPGLAGDTYWFEVSGYGEPECGIRANWSRDHGNEHNVASQVVNPGGIRDYNLAGIGNVDVGFCENSGIGNPGIVLGSCCTCPQNCQPDFTQRDCGVIRGVWRACATCAESPCPEAPANDLCDSPFLVSNVPEHHIDDPVVSIELSGENICAFTDGPGLDDDPASGGCSASLDGTADMFNDIWYRYTATACGDLTVESCGAADMDQMLAVYDATNACPMTDSDEIACGDDTCGIGAGPATVTVRVLDGHEYLIRMGGWNNLSFDGDPRGSFVFNWSLATGVCPTVEPIGRAEAPHDILKNRYISVDPRGSVAGENPAQMHIRVMVDSSEVPGQLGAGPWWATSPVNGAGLSPAVCISVLSSTKPAAEPDWSGCDTVHLTGCQVIPTTTYAIAAEAGGELSADTLLDTQAKPGVKWHGDCVGYFNGDFWTPPNGVTSIDDAVAGIKTFQDPTKVPGCNSPPCNATHLSVTDMHPNLNGETPNLRVNINDVFSIILGFQGVEFSGPDLDQCP